MEYKKYIYDEIIEKINDCIKCYEEWVNKSNLYQLFLANGDVIKYSIHRNNIAHLLGVDLNKLVSYKIMEKEESYDMLKKLVNDSHKYWNDMKGKLNYEEIFSPFIKQKLDNFSEQLKVPYPNQINFVCKYDRERNYATKEIDGLYADYYMARTNDEGDVVLLGLLKKEGNICVPQTTRVILNNELFEKNMTELLKNQVVTYLNGLNINNTYSQYNKTINLNIMEISSKLQALDDACNMTGGIPSTLSDHIYNLKTLSKNKTASYDSKSVLVKVSEMMNNKELVELESDEKDSLDFVTIRLIDSYNDSLFKEEVVSKKTKMTFSETKKEKEKYISENRKLINELEELKSEFISLQNKLDEKENEVNVLNEEKKEYDELKVKVLELAKSIK